jgi:CAAX protease family protein
MEKKGNLKGLESQELHKLLEKYKKSLKIFENFKSGRMAAETLLKIGEVYEKLMNYDQALENYFIALNLYRDEDDLRGEIQTLINLGNLWAEEKNYSESRKYYEQALNLTKRIKDIEMERKVTQLISSCFQAEGALEDAIEIHQELNKLPLNTLQQDEERLKIGKLKIESSKVHLSIETGLILLFYIIALIVAEIVTNYYFLSWGILIEAVIIIFLIIQSSLYRSTQFSYLLQAMILVPLMRIMSLSIPVKEIEPLYWLAILIVPLLAACLILIRSQNLSWSRVGLTLGNLPLQLIIGFSGLFLGFIEYLILQPKALIPNLYFFNLIFASVIIIISTGFIEELIFRGIIQKNAENLLGKVWGLLFVSVLFTSQHIGWNSVLDLTFVLGVSLIYGYVFMKTRSILGVSLSHGLSNVVLFLILPFIL